MTEDKMVGWHHQLDRHEFEQAPGVGDGQEILGVLQSMGWKRVRHDLVKEQHPFVRDIYMYKRNLHFLRVYQEEGDDQISRNSYQWRRYPQICKPNPCFLCFPSNLA